VADGFCDVGALIAEKGYRIVYEQTYATETASENVAEELKRKIHAAAGDINHIAAKSLFNPFPYTQSCIVPIYQPPDCYDGRLRYSLTHLIVMLNIA